MYCKIKGCNNKIYCKHLCGKHYKQIQVHGKILTRTIYDPNEIIIMDDYAEIILYTRNGIERTRTKIDFDDVARCSKYKWGLDGSGYTYNTNIGSIHRFIMKPPDGMVVDHINHDTLDNRKSNLRVCTRQENMFNCKKQSNNSSSVSGVCWDRRYGKWRGFITYNNKHIHLGYFKDFKKAVITRKTAELKYFSEYRLRELFNGK